MLASADPPILAAIAQYEQALAATPQLSSAVLAAVDANATLASAPPPEEPVVVATAPELSAALASSVNPAATFGYALGLGFEALAPSPAVALQAETSFLSALSSQLENNAGICVDNYTGPAAGLGSVLNDVFCNITGTVPAGAIGNTGIVSNLSQPQSQASASSQSISASGSMLLHLLSDFTSALVFLTRLIKLVTQSETAGVWACTLDVLYLIADCRLSEAVNLLHKARGLQCPHNIALHVCHCVN